MIELSNEYLTVRICMGSGLVTFLASPLDGANLIKSQVVRYQDQKQRIWEVGSDSGPAASNIPVQSIHKSGADATVRFQSKHLGIEMVYSLPAKSPLLKVVIAVRGVAKTPVPLRSAAFPGFFFADDFLDAFEDEVDRYSDGAELGNGRELPCWRVFHRNGRRTGILLATRGKHEMAHMVVHARGFSVEPHSRLNYTSVPLASHPPLLVSAGKLLRNQFSIGPWHLPAHQKMLRAAGLTKPIAAKVPAPRGHPPTGLEGKVISLVKVAGDAAAKDYSPRRWQIVAMPWARDGVALFATTGVKPPPIRFDPKLRGAYRVYVGVGNASGAALRLTGDPETRFRVCGGPSYQDSEDDALRLFLTGSHRARELDFGVIRMDAKKVTLPRFPNRQSPAVLDYMRFVPLRPEEQTAFDQEQSCEPSPPLSGMVDTPDLTTLLDGDNPDPRTIASIVWEHANSGIRKCHWRIDGQCSDFPSRHNTMRYVSAKVHGVYCPHSKSYGRLLRACNALQVAVDAAKKYGVGLWGWMRFNNYSGNVQSDFFKNHPEFREENERGVREAKLCIAHPEVRRHKINILVEAAQYGLNGICIGILRHPPAVGYARILCEAYERSFGQPPPRRASPTSAEMAFSSSLPFGDQEWVRWWRFRAQFMTLFGRELRAALDRKKLARVKVALWVRPNHCIFDGIDLDAWLNEGLCEEVITQDYGENLAETGWDQPQWKKRVRSRVPLVRAVWPEFEKAAQPMVARILREGYDGICFYESNETVLKPEFIRLCRSLRRPQSAKSA